MAGALAALLLLVPGSAAQMGRGPGAGRGPGPEGPSRECAAPRFAGLDLTDQQREQIRDIHEAQRDEHVRLNKDIRRLEHALRGELLKDEPSPGTLRDLAEQIGRLRTQERILDLEQQLAVRKVLTPAQRDRMLAAPGGPHRGRGDGHGRRERSCRRLAPPPPPEPGPDE
jgi:Spy/CpxP family protein refolding chaperone